MAEDQKQVRRSGLLLSGKVISTGLKFVTQLLIVRYLSKTDYGFFAYGLTLVALLKHVSNLGLENAVPRFLPIFHEKGDYSRLLGTVLISFVTVIFTTAIIIAAIFAYPGLMNRLVSGPDAPVSLLLILIFLVPVESIDVLMVGIWASFKSPKQIFFRNYILAPVLSLLVVLAMIFFGADVLFLAKGYLVAALFGSLLFLYLLFRMLSREGILTRDALRSVNLPVKEVFSFSLPMLINNLPVFQMRYISIFLLGYLHDSSSVALFAAVLPLANLNRIIPMTFGTMFTPSASRYLARREFSELNRMYWLIAHWLTVLGFPIFLVTFSSAENITTLAFGEKYATSWMVLAMVSFSHYLQAYTGFNSMTLVVAGQIRFIFVTRMMATACGFILALLLIPDYGATGAALATGASSVFHTVAHHFGLKRIEGMELLPRRYAETYAAVLLISAGLFVVDYLFSLNLVIMIALAAVFSLIVFLRSKRELELENTFPEVLKVPVLRWLLG